MTELRQRKKQNGAASAGARATTSVAPKMTPKKISYPLPPAAPGILGMLRKTTHFFSYLLILFLKPFKMIAWRTNSSLLRGFILEITSRLDWLMIILNVQNNAMLLHRKAYSGGNFFFGKALAKVSYDETEYEIKQPLNKCSHFMGVNIVSSSPSTFGTNAGTINQCPVVRKPVRKNLHETVFTPKVYESINDIDKMRAETAEVLQDWIKNPDMKDHVVLRSTATRLVFRALTGKLITAEDALHCTENYMHRFGEFSIFGYYFPFMIGLLETEKKIRSQAYFYLKNKYDIDLATIDMTLFAAMFSIGTHVMRTVYEIARNKIDYKNLPYQQKRNLIYEGQRFFPTVTSVHKMIEQEETVKVDNKDIKLTLGDEVIYPFICSNRDPTKFSEPELFRVDRPKEQYDSVLSWSKGPHYCPAKEFSIIASIIMLDALSERYGDLHKLSIFAPGF